MLVHSSRVSLQPPLWPVLICVVPEYLPVSVNCVGVHAHDEAAGKRVAGNVYSAGWRVSRDGHPKAGDQAHPFLAAGIQVLELRGFVVGDVGIAELALFCRRVDFVSEFLVDFGMLEEEVEDSGECGSGCVGTGNPNLRINVVSGLSIGVGFDIGDSQGCMNLGLDLYRAIVDLVTILFENFENSPKHVPSLLRRSS